MKKVLGILVLAFTLSLCNYASAQEVMPEDIQFHINSAKLLQKVEELDYLMALYYSNIKEVDTSIYLLKEVIRLETSASKKKTYRENLKGYETTLAELKSGLERMKQSKKELLRVLNSNQ